MIVGRHRDCGAGLNYPEISRQHCRFFVRDGQIWVEDAGSRNGTCLNGQALAEARPLRDGDNLLLAHFPFQVRLGASAQMSSEPSASVSLSDPVEAPHHVLVVENNVAAVDTLAQTQWRP
jgi:pSer/pThr/pTyr-binding forkhead associated (FHA) protein